MARTISQIKFIETTPFDYQLSFIYDGNNLETENIPRISKQEEVVAVINKKLDAWDLGRAKTNYDTLKALFEGKNVNI